jgi:hypothetical protein
MKSLYFGERFDVAVCSVSESLLFAAEDANETALFWRNMDVEEVVFGRLRIGPVGGNVDNDDGTLNADESLNRLSVRRSSSSAKEDFFTYE